MDEAPLKQAVRYLLEHGAAVELIGETELPMFDMEGRSVSASQVVFKPHATGMGNAT